MNDPRWSTSAAFTDYDRDGDLDLFVANYIDFTLKGNKRCYTPTGEVDFAPVLLPAGAGSPLSQPRRREVCRRDTDIGHRVRLRPGFRRHLRGLQQRRVG